MSNKYNKTIVACFIGYIVQAIVNNFAPLLFLTFGRTYHISFSQLTMLVTINFGVQLLVDVLSIKFIDRIGYRISMVLAHLFAAGGLIALTFLPEIMKNSYAGVLTAVIIYAIGGGLLEVLVSPVVEACPSENKERAMSMLHSFYCWGHVGVVALSTLFFQFIGISNWKVLTIIWAVIPLGNALAFIKVPIAPLLPEGESGLQLKDLFKMKLFWVLLIMMICAGASEQAVSQWASVFAERGLGITKSLGDLAGPMMFAIMMGLSRLFYGKYGDRINLDRFMIYSSLLCVASYLGVSLLPSPQLSLIACGVCGLSVGIMWPGTFSKAASAMGNGGTALFAMLALGGDIGCSGGPTLVGLISSRYHDNLKVGILAAIIFPILLLVGILLCKRWEESKKSLKHCVER
ncbi:fucose permease [Aequitasia blattaphilus]|uniref:MFS transporter n=1 Tax=Aequitasia blattaphilus TaxID=2949332 RepID=A0ABT1EBY6_9FIRM|nr:MFS transporter [Aequitasia blattaphilus]MCP1103323.1 MFS transporter [Aequitasia blattaphilus]MCR8615963.1 MFS transporter [Aequitasia blattaphilus]